MLSFEKPTTSDMPMAKETGKLLSVLRSKNLKAKAWVAGLNTVTKLALLDFRGVDCSDIATITDIGIGPNEMTAMIKKATNKITHHLRKMYLEIGDKELEKAVENFITGIGDSTKNVKQLEKTKDQGAMLRIVCSVQAAIAELEKVSGVATKEIGKVSAAPMSAEAETLFNKARIEHDFDTLDDLLAEARARTDIPNAPTGKSTRKGGKRKHRTNANTTRRRLKRNNSTKRRSSRKSRLNQKKIPGAT